MGGVLPSVAIAPGATQGGAIDAHGLSRGEAHPTTVGRTVDCWDGLALLGRASVGPLTVRTPGLIEPLGPGPASPELTIESRPAPSGTRGITISDGTGRLELAVPILAPEILGAPDAGVPAGPGTVLVHAPLATPPSPIPSSDRPELVVLGNARALWDAGEPFVRAVGEARAVYGAAPLLWAPRVALPHRLAFLAYLGIDLVDATEGLLEASGGRFLDPALGRMDPTVAREERLCECPACRSLPPGRLEDHTRSAYRRALSEVRAAARAGRLRELVESRLPAESALAEMLRYADRDLAAALEERAPVTAEGVRNYSIAEAHRRPEMVRFRGRLRERYRPPPSKAVLLLVPCSKTKPYRASRSHRRFAHALEGLRGLERLHFVSVSSPIGVVPRELEDVPPARHYDIPVTGEWTEPEREAVLEGIRHLVTYGRYRSVVVHLDPQEYAFVRAALAGPLRVRWTLLDDRTTAAGALAALREAVGEALATEPSVPGGPLAVVREELGELASFQFGRHAAGRLLTAPVRLAGRPWFQRLTDGRNDLATVREERGLLHLTIAGARRLLPLPPLAVEVDPTISLAGDLFTPGVRAADREIRSGDSVVLLQNGGLAGVGEAALPGPLMTELRHGLAVRVRHRARAPTDMPMSEKAPASGEGPVV